MLEPWTASLERDEAGFGWAERTLDAIPTMSDADLIELASLPMALPPEGMRAIDLRVRWEARRLLHARGRRPVLEPRPPGGRFESIAMLHGQLPNGIVGNDGVPLALVPGGDEPSEASGIAQWATTSTHVHTPFCKRLTLHVVEETGAVVASLGGNDDEEDDD